MQNGLSTILLAFTLLLGFSLSALASQPQIIGISLPPYGSTQPLRGKIINVDPTTVRLATYLFKEGLGWFVKPTFASPCTPIQPDGQWEVNITTGFCDRWATKYALYLVPNDKSCPPASGTAVPPPELDAIALTSIRVNRNPFLDNPLTFAGRFWVIKDSGNDACKVGPGLNIFAPQNVWVDENGLHLAITGDSGVWRTAEVWLNESLGFGEYRVLIQPLLNDLDPQAVFGAFLWDQEAPPHFRELDFELSRFGNPTDQNNAQFVAQPFSQVGNLFRFTIPISDLRAGLTYTQLWLPGEVTFSIYRGHHLGNPPESDLIARWTKKGTAVPGPGTENFRFNLWLFNGLAPQGGQPQEVVISHFAFTPSPTLTLTLTGCSTCQAGNRFAVEAHVINPSARAVLVEVKAGVRLPDGTTMNLLGNKHLESPLPAGIDTTFILFDVPSLPAGLPTGTWTFEGTLLGSDLGETFSREVKPFKVVP